MLVNSFVVWGEQDSESQYNAGHIKRRLFFVLVNCGCFNSCYNNPQNTETGILIWKRKGKVESSVIHG